MEALPYILIINSTLLAAILLWIASKSIWQKFTLSLSPKKLVVPPFGAKVKIRTTGATYESRFMYATKEGWAIEAIETLTDVIPAIRRGETTLVEISCPNGVVRFRTELVELLTSDDATILRPPLETAFGNRRNRNRLKLEDKPAVYLEGASAMVHDVSEAGARVSTNYVARRGERVKVDIPGSEEPVFCSVLEVLPNVTRGYSNDVRIIFEQPIKMRDLKKKFAPAR